MKLLTITALALTTAAHAQGREDYEVTTMTFDDVAEMSNAAMRAAVAAVVADDFEADDELDENGTHVVMTNRHPACGRIKNSKSPVCDLTIAACRVVASNCTLASAVACFVYTSRTSGESGGMCLPTFGACDQMRSEPSREYDTGECTVHRWRGKAK